MKNPLSIRPMTENDAEPVSDLMPVLGYAASTTMIRERFFSIPVGSSDCLFVAETTDEIVGFCHVKGIRRVDSDGYGEILTLVVKVSHQRSGVGRALVQRATEWIFAIGFSRVRLGSGVHRTEAHLFYESLGFTKSRPSCAFELHRKAENASTQSAIA